MTNQISLHLPAAWHFSCYSGTNGRGRYPLSVMATLAILIIIAFFIILHFSRNELSPLLSSPSRPQRLLHDDPSQNHYGAVIDAGSSGSRIFIYTWPTHGGNPGHLLSIRHLRDWMGRILVKKIQPGLSSLKNRPHDAGSYMRPLLDFANVNIPRLKTKETPLYILATAGMRMLDERSQNQILASLRHEVKTHYQFLFNDNQVEIISGKEEGIFAWIAVNYVMGRFRHDDVTRRDGDQELTDRIVPPSSEETRQHLRKHTFGIIDMGGGSVQIAYEVDKSEQVEPTWLAEFNLGCRSTDADHLYRLYVSTFLQYGANVARSRYEQHLTLNVTSLHVNTNSSVTSLHVNTNSSVTSLTSSTSSVAVISPPRRSLPPAVPAVSDPCMPRGLAHTLLRDNIQIRLQGSGDYESCRRSLLPLLNLTTHCSHPPCTISGQHMAPIRYKKLEFIGFSEYFYTTEGLLNNDGLYEYRKFVGASKMYCSTPWSVIQKRYRSDLFRRATSDRRRSQCFKSAWITEVLHHGFHFPTDYVKFRPVGLVEGHEVQWTLGALLYKTRHFPLREVQRQELERYKPPWKHRIVAHFPTQYFLTACIVLVLLSIILYVRRLRRIMAPDPGYTPPPTFHGTYQSLPTQSTPTEPDEVVIVQGEIFKH